jgi:hypothetical protein
MSQVSESNRLIARTAAEAFGGRPEVVRYHDDAKRTHVDVLRCEDRPQRGVSSYSTIGLSDWPLYRGDEEYPARVELVGACSAGFDHFANVLASAAFAVANEGWFCAPGIIFPGLFAGERPTSPLKHLLFVPPFLWEQSLRTLDLLEKKVAWLLAVPISDAEMMFAEKEGPRRLEDVFEKEQIDIYDPDRPSVR